MTNYKKYKIGELFVIKTSKKKINAVDATFLDTGHPYVVRTSANNGVRGKIIANEEWLNDGNTIAFGQDTGTIFYQPESYFTGDKIKVMTLKNGHLNESIALYLIAAMKQGFRDFKWGQSSFNVDTLKDVEIMLPTDKKGAPDFDFMAERIATLEAERLAALEAYLVATGLDDYKLLDEDRGVLSRKVELRECRMGDVFIKLKAPYKGIGRKQDNVSKSADTEYNLPLINCKYNNNGIMYYGREDDFVWYENVLSIIYNGPPTEGQTYFQEKIGVYTDAYLIGMRDGTRLNRESGLYLAAAVNASIHNERNRKYSRGNKATWENKVENDSIFLPVTANGHLDYNYMSAYIRAQEKIAVANAVKLKDEIIAQTKNIIA